MSRTPPMAYQPPLSWWSRTWRLSVAALIGVTAVGAVIADSGRSLTPGEDRFLLLDFALGAVATVVCAFRRRGPVTVNTVLTALCAVSITATGPAALGLMSLATRRRWVEILPMGLAGLAAGEAVLWVNPLYPESARLSWPDFTATAALLAALIALGMYLGSRRELLWTLRDRAERAEAEQELRVAQAKTNERTRIAREMHDVLAHRISLVSMHAGALGFRPDLSEADRARAAGIIQENAHRALVDLRQVLGVLRGDGERDDHPQPTLRDIGELVAEARTFGARLGCEVDVPDIDAVPEGLGRTVYHVVREGLTNARKHAPGALVSVAVSGGPEHGLTVRVTNRLAVGVPGAPETPGAGLGLVGLAERAELAGGSLVTTRADGDFVLTVLLPWRVDEH